MEVCWFTRVAYMLCSVEDYCYQCAAFFFFFLDKLSLSGALVVYLGCRTSRSRVMW